MFVLGILAELLAANRALIEDILMRLKRVELREHGGPRHYSSK
jgi:hypothetical protein